MSAPALSTPALSTPALSTFDGVYDKLAGGTVGNWLAIVGLLSLIYWGWLIAVALQNRAARARTVPAPAASPVLASADAVGVPGGIPDGDIAVIAAAVHAVLGAGRILHLVPDDGGRTWASEGRWLQQTSHKTR